MLAGDCNVIGNVPGYPQIVRTGSNVRVTFTGGVYPCGFPSVTTTAPAGVFSAGSYAMQVDFFYIDPFGSLFTEAIGTVPFTVTGAIPPAVSAPTMGTPGVLTLMLVLSGLAIWDQWRRRVRE